MDNNKSNTKKTRNQYNGYEVTNEYLLGRIFKAGLLYDHLHCVCRYPNGAKIFYFDRTDEIKEIIDNFTEYGLLGY